MDFSVISRLGLELPPIGIKYSFFEPEGIKPLEYESAMSLCEMMREAMNRSEPFYFCRKHNETCVGKNILGMESFAGFAKSGLIGKGLGVFNEPRCNGRLYKYVECLEKDTVNFVSFAQYDKINFNPDLMIFAAPPSVAELILRAATYSTGELYTSVCTPVMGCSWLFAYPFKNDKINYIIPALVHGPHGRQLFNENTLLIAVPYRWIPAVLLGLNEMTYDLKGHEGIREYHEEFEGIVADLGVKAEKLKEDFGI